VTGETRSMRPRSDERSPTALALQAVGAAAGIVAFVYLVGGLVIRARLGALDLPQDPTVSLIPRETILIAGARVLVPTFGLGLFVVALVWLLPHDWITRDAPTTRYVVLSVSVAGVLAAYALSLGAGHSFLLPALSVCVLCAFPLYVVCSRTENFAGRTAALFATIAVSGGAIALLRAHSLPVSLDFATVHLRDGARTNGFLLGRSQEAVVLAPDVLHRTIGRVVVLPARSVVALRLARSGLGAKPLKRIDPILTSRIHVGGTRIAKSAEEALEQLRNIRESALWKYPPLMLLSGIGLWLTRYDEFAGNRVVRWTPKGQQVALRLLNEEPNAWEHRVIITTGRLVAEIATPTGDSVRQFLVLESTDRRYRAVCTLSRPRRRQLQVGNLVSVRGVMLAAGVVVTGGGDERRRVVLGCSAAHGR
jgi:hypothetical protein